MKTVSFGDIFRHKEEEYVYLAIGDKILYASKILTREYTRQIEDLYTRRDSNPNSREKAYVDEIFCYVILKTKEFQGRAAHLKGTDENNDNIDFDLPGRSLDQSDKLKLKEEILNDKSKVIPKKLKKLVEDLDI